MRTTLVIDDDILKQARQRAAELGLSLSAVVERALREALRPDVPPPRPFSMVTFGGGESQRDLTPREVAEILADDEIDRAVP